MRKALGFALLIAGIAGQAAAGAVTPEIGASTAVGALTLLSGGILVLRSRRSK
jgi:hypothetical protein